MTAVTRRLLARPLCWARGHDLGWWLDPREVRLECDRCRAVLRRIPRIRDGRVA